MPLVRIKKVDSIEAVTDFQSASDHSITLQKFQEMNLALVTPLDDENKQKEFVERLPKSVFEESSDVTALDFDEAADKVAIRWRFRGPWLAGMTEGRFNSYVKTIVKKSLPGFHQLLRRRLAAEKTESLAQQAREEQLEEAPRTVSPEDITESELSEYIRKIREDWTLLYNIVSRYLDLAPMRYHGVFHGVGMSHVAANRMHEISPDNPYAASGPPISHPSAGLSYLRTTSYLDNHPVYGPQAHHPPVKARILTPVTRSGDRRAMFGVGGFVTSAPTDTSFSASTNLAGVSNVPGLHKIDLTSESGTKVYLQPKAAFINAHGRVRVVVDEADSNTIVVQKERIGEGSALKGAQQEMRTEVTYERPKEQKRLFVKPMYGSSEKFGFGSLSRGREL